MMYTRMWGSLFVFLMAIGILCEAKANTIVSGKIQGLKGKTISLNYQGYALLESMVKLETEVGPDGGFRFDIPISKPVRAFLVLGTTPVEEEFSLSKGDGKDTTVTSKTNRAEIVYLYLKPKGDQYVEVTVGEIPQTLKITAKNSADSYYLNQEDWRFNQYKDKHLKNYFAYVHYDPIQYQNYVDGRKAERMQFLSQFSEEHKITKHLKHVSEWTIYTDGVMARLLYPSMRGSYRKDNYQADSHYYGFLDDVQVDRTKGDKGIGYFYFLDYFLKESYKLSGSDKDYIDFVSEKLSNRSLYEYYAFALQTNFKRDLYDKFGPGCPYRDIAKKVREKYRKLEGMLEGNRAPLVTLQDTSGNTFTFEKWKGKYIYIDFWATWCGPCIEEIPSLKALEKDYVDKDIVFVSISMDREKDREKWIAFVRNENLQGVQVWMDAANQKQISETFNILQIPRFVLLDDNGQVVDANSPRPSDFRIRTLLDKLL